MAKVTSRSSRTVKEGAEVAKANGSSATAKTQTECKEATNPLIRNAPPGFRGSLCVDDVFDAADSAVKRADVHLRKVFLLLKEMKPRLIESGGLLAEASSLRDVGKVLLNVKAADEKENCSEDMAEFRSLYSLWKKRPVEALKPFTESDVLVAISKFETVLLRWLGDDAYDELERSVFDQRKSHR